MKNHLAPHRLPLERGLASADPDSRTEIHDPDTQPCLLEQKNEAVETLIADSAVPPTVIYIASSPLDMPLLLRYGGVLVIAAAEASPTLILLQSVVPAMPHISNWTDEEIC